VSSSALAPGAIVAGKYRVESVLGRGGMGIVLAATHRDLGTRVALKVLTVEAGPGRDDAVARFLGEARAAAKLRSEFVARVHDFGTLDEGRPFMVLEFLEGDDLSALLQRGMTTTDLVDAIIQACAGLAEAHAEGIVHRDLKPSNLFRTTRPDGSHCTKVLDFGISKLVGKTAAEALVTTKTTAVLGTPLYMSPEQVRSTRDIDARSDVWSLGVVLSEALAGRAPFGGETLGEVFSRILEADAPTEVPPEVPSGLVAVARRCLEKKPDQRYASVSDLAAALEPYASDEGRDAARRARNTRRAKNTPPAAAGAASASPAAETVAVDAGDGAATRQLGDSSPRAAATADEGRGSLQRSDVDLSTAQTQAALSGRRVEPGGGRGRIWFGALGIGILAVIAVVYVTVQRPPAGSGTPPPAPARAEDPPHAPTGSPTATAAAPEVEPRAEAAPPATVEPAGPAVSASSTPAAPVGAPRQPPRPPATPPTGRPPAPAPSPAKTAAPSRPTLD
jgi:hypothetical protein